MALYIVVYSACNVCLNVQGCELCGDVEPPSGHDPTLHLSPTQCSSHQQTREQSKHDMKIHVDYVRSLDFYSLSLSLFPPPHPLSL